METVHYLLLCFGKAINKIDYATSWVAEALGKLHLGFWAPKNELSIAVMVTGRLQNS